MFSFFLILGVLFVCLFARNGLSTVESKMTKRKLLTMITAMVAFVGLLISAMPFVQSMLPNDVAKDSTKRSIPLTQIPAEGAIEAAYRGYKALIVREPELRVFLMPYFDGAYRLPDPTWERAIVPCKNFILHSDGFSCADPDLHESWNEQATWNLAGENLGTWMPSLLQAKFRVEGDYLVLSPEYE